MTRQGPKICPPLRFDCSPLEGSPDIMTCTAHRLSDNAEVGYIDATREVEPGDTSLARVRSIKVHGALRCGIGTKLYEKLAEEACRKGLRLASDVYRTRFSEGFWKKQVARGRAMCVAKKTKKKRGGAMLDDRLDSTGRQWRCRQYAMKECAAGPIDLSGTSPRRINWRAIPVARKRRRKA